MREEEGADSAVRVWIDATGARSTLRVFGMTLLERLLRALAQVGVKAEEVRVELAEGTAGDAVVAALPADARGLFTLSSSHTASPLEGLRETIAQSKGTPVLVFSAETVVDTRVIAHITQNGLGSVALVSGEGEQRSALLRLEGSSDELETVAGGAAFSVLTLAERLLADGIARPLADSGFESHIVSLRRDLEPYVLAVPSESVRKDIERMLFWWNYKGSTDFMTRYVYPPLVWLMVPPLARWRVHPNWVTAVDIAATIVAIPFFMAGMWGPGLFFSYLMSVLDSVDGKLARVTYTSSKLGNVLDHGLDIVHPPFWYLAWGWALASGDTTAAPYQAAVVMFWLYVADRLCAPLFRHRTGRSIHGYEPIDERMRTFISRRNVNLPVFTAAVLLDWWLGGDFLKNVTFGLIVLWQGACLAFHIVRVIQCWSPKTQTPQPTSAQASPAESL